MNLSRLFSLLLLGLASGTAKAQSATPLGPTGGEGLRASLRGVSPTHDRQRLHFDRPGDGALWARSHLYKARFDQDGACFVPYLGPQATRNYPVEFALRTVRYGDHDVAYKADAAPQREDQTVSFDRGSLTEFYVMSPESMEQRFRFDVPQWELDAAPRDLVLTLDVTTELSSREPAEAGCGAAFEWGCDLGSVRYGRATVFDAQGIEAAAPTAHAPGGIEIRVPADFLARATYPLTIDPVISSFSVYAEDTIDLFPDVAFVAGADRYAVVWQSFFSGTDWDVWCVTYTLAGVPIAGTWIDQSVTSWAVPRIASSRFLSRFMVVAQAGDAPNRYVSFRWRDANSTNLGPVREIFHGAETLNPDIGGDPKAFGTNYCIAFESVGSTGFRRVAAVVTDQEGFPFSGFLDVSGAIDEALRPAVSNSCGPGPAAYQAWTIAYESVQSASDHDIYLRRIRPDGTLGNGSSLEVGGANDRFPAVSSPLDGDTDQRMSLVTWVRDNGGQDDVMGRVIVGVSWITALQNLSAILSPGSLADDQQTPSVDSDGSTFFLSWGGERPDGTFDVSVGALSHADSNLYEAEPMSTWSNGTRSEILPRIVSRRSGGGAVGTGAMGVWIEQVGLLGGDIAGGLYESPGVGDVFCTSLPHSGGQRARLSAEGSVSLASENLTLLVTDGPPNKPGLFFMGEAAINLPFGEGRRCVGGMTFRIQPVEFTDAQGHATRSLDFDATYSAGLHANGAVTFFQYWFRDPQGGPEGFNLSDGLRIEFTP